MTEEKVSVKKNTDDEKIMAAISYVSLLFLLPLLLRKDSDFAQFHAKQGFVFFIFSTIVGVVSWIPLFGWALCIIAFVLFIMGILNALNYKKEQLPIIGKYADKFNL